MKRKQIKRYISKRVLGITGAAAFAGASFSFAGCGMPDLPFLSKGGSGTGSYIFNVGSEKCSEQEAKILLMNYQKEYSSLYGIDMWSQDTGTEESLEEYVKDITLSQLAEVYTLDVIADNKDVALTSKERNKAGQAAKEYYKGLSSAEKDYLDADESDVESLFERYLLAKKLYESVTEDVNKEVSDSEACVMEVQQVKIAEKEVADEVYAKLKDGTDIYSLPSAYMDVDVEDRNITRTTFDAAYEENLFSLETGQYSGIIDMQDAYYIFYCVNAFNSELTDKNKENVLAKRMQDAVNQVYGSYADHISSAVNENDWEEVYVDKSLDLTGASFMEVFRSYFGDFTGKENVYLDSV